MVLISKAVCGYKAVKR